MNITATLAEIRTWPREAQRELVEQLQAELEIDPTPVNLTPELLAELKRREAESEAHPELDRPWREVHARLRDK